MLSSTLCAIHNERFTVKLADDIRASIDNGSYREFKREFMARYLARGPLTS